MRQIFCLKKAVKAAVSNFLLSRNSASYIYDNYEFFKDITGQFMSHPGVKHFLAIILVGVNLMSIAYAEGSESSRSNIIQVSGVGRVSMQPDKADLILAVDVQGKTAKATHEQAANAMAALIETIKNLAVAEKDIQTSYVSLQPEYDQTGNKIVRYRLNNQVTVCVRDISKVGAVVDAALQAGGDATRVQILNFGIDNSTEALVQAREKAYEDAQSKAAQYAKLAGVKLGRVIRITEGNSAMPVPYAREAVMMKASVDTPMQAGEQELSVTVGVTFAIE